MARLPDVGNGNDRSCNELAPSRTRIDRADHARNDLVHRRLVQRFDKPGRANAHARRYVETANLIAVSCPMTTTARPAPRANEPPVVIGTVMPRPSALIRRGVITTKRQRSFISRPATGFGAHSWKSQPEGATSAKPGLASRASGEPIVDPKQAARSAGAATPSPRPSSAAWRACAGAAR